MCDGGSVINSKRKCSTQKHRSNVPADSPELFHKRSIFLPLLDGVITQMDSRFSKHNKNALKLGIILPNQAKHIVDSESENTVNIEECFNFYRHLLPYSSLERAKGEFHIWSTMWSSREVDTIPEDAIGALNECDRNTFPLIHQLLKILAIQPVSTASAERSFSCLRRLKDWMRSTMGEERLSGLALMALNRDKISLADAEEVLNRFAAKKDRRLNITL